LASKKESSIIALILMMGLSMKSALIPLYLAGPDVFLPNACEVGRRKIQLCRTYGFEGLFPLDDIDDSEAIFRRNCSRMQRAEVAAFNLTPFRGVSADAGTIYELGYMEGLGKKPLFGYTSNTLTYQERVMKTYKTRNKTSHSLLVENYKLADNLMICEAIYRSGGEIVATEEEDNDSQSLTAFRAFEQCLQLLRQRLTQTIHEERRGELRMGGRHGKVHIQSS
jgi:nucleoside 2-deoxyribosyltransferase